MNKDTISIIANGGGASLLGLSIPDLLAMVPPKYQPIASAGMMGLAILIGLFQKKPASSV